MGDPLMLARVQFALTAGTHFLFVALTLGLATLVALMQTRATISGEAVHARMTRFWGQLYVVNYAVGIVTGLVMEFQFGLNWAGMSRTVGGVFGAPLALETVVAFFVESTFLGLWIFGWERLNRWLHLTLIWVVTLTAYLSAYFVLVANGWLQRPVGYEMRDGHARLTDVGALLGNPTALLAFGHVLFGGLLTAGFFLAAVSGHHLRRRTAEVELFRKSMRTGLLTVILAVMPVVMLGAAQFGYLQPTKSGGGAKAAAAEADFTARFGPDHYRAPGLAQVAAGVMMLMWLLMVTVAVVALVMFPFRRWLERGRVFHVTMIVALPLPYVAMIAGWVFREVGRQPWMVYGVLKTRDALSDTGTGTITASFLLFTTLFAVLTCVNVWLLARFARRGPQEPGLGAGAASAPAPVMTPTF
ncbi:cytochrome ubiquinol oxidase subunit I [Actinomadura roseirufa]|uniref:cytochrome ubiquinol oxidase subunit I n=1 Tax=Actinomadura roseirufa TaxID=2094049 RepID=UPI0010419911|nr:cytochrome ubiquinol oxidase subunit I [Actinomadura roseirufa]